MKDGKRYGLAGVFLVVLMLTSAGGLLSACNTVAGAGQDMSDLGHHVSTDARQVQQQIPPPPP